MNQAKPSQENSNKNAENAALKHALARLEKANKQLSSENTNLSAENIRLSSKNNHLNSKVQQLSTTVKELDSTVQGLKDHLAWFKRNLFGSKSEKHVIGLDPAVQPSLFADLAKEYPAPEQEVQNGKTISYTRRAKKRDGFVNDMGLRFTDDVPKKIIKMPVPEHLKGCEVISTKITYKLAQRRSSNLILEYHCPVVKELDTGKIHNLNKPNNVFAGSIADVSFMAGMVVDKFAWHLPLYRQHQRLAQAGVGLSRTTLTNLVGRAAALLSPIHIAQLESVLKSQVLSVDETPIKAGTSAKSNNVKGKLNTGYFWPLYGDKDEVSFTFSNTRARSHIDKTLGNHFNGTLLTDGYSAYNSYVAKQKERNNILIHAACWAHARRKFEQAQDNYPESGDALKLLARVYKAEADIRQKGLTGEEKLNYRIKYSEPLVHEFWQWCNNQIQRPDLEPSGRLAKAIKYAFGEKHKLQVFLSDPDVPIDNNHTERCIRPVAMGRKNWMFCWTEVGAQYVGIIQSLISTCRLHDIDPYTYLVDVLQRVDQHPASEVEQLTPRLWKQHFAENPLKSDVDLY